MVFDLEIGNSKVWRRLAAEEKLVNISEDGRSCCITLDNPGYREQIQIGAKIRLSMILAGHYHTFVTSVKNIRRARAGMLAGLRIHRGMDGNSMRELSSWSKSLALEISYKTI